MQLLDSSSRHTAGGPSESPHTPLITPVQSGPPLEMQEAVQEVQEAVASISMHSVKHEMARQLLTGAGQALRGW